MHTDGLPLVDLTLSARRISVHIIRMCKLGGSADTWWNLGKQTSKTSVAGSSFSTEYIMAEGVIKHAHSTHNKTRNIYTPH